MNISVKPATFAENATTVGAVSLVLERILNFSIPKEKVKEMITGQTGK